MHNYPRCGVPAAVAFVLSLDVEWPAGGRPRMATHHLQSGLSQFPDVWLKGVSAILEAQLAEAIVIVGGREARYPERDVRRPDTIREILDRDCDIDSSRISCVLSEPNTIGNAHTIREWIWINSPMDHDAIVVCAYRHAARSALDLRVQGIDLPVFPSEAIWLAAAHDEAARIARREYLQESLGGGDLAKRIVGECNGIADKLCGAYRPFSDRAKVQTAA